MSEIKYFKRVPQLLSSNWNGNYLVKLHLESAVFIFYVLCLIQLWSCMGTDVKTVCK